MFKLCIYNHIFLQLNDTKGNNSTRQNQKRRDSVPAHHFLHCNLSGVQPLRYFLQRKKHKQSLLLLLFSPEGENHKGIRV